SDMNWARSLAGSRAHGERNCALPADAAQSSRFASAAAAESIARPPNPPPNAPARTAARAASVVPRARARAWSRRAAIPGAVLYPFSGGENTQSVELRWQPKAPEDGAYLRHVKPRVGLSLD